MTNKDGKEVRTKLSAKEALKQMYDDTDRYGHLFQGTAKGGLGGDGNASVKPKDMKNMDHKDYLKQRKNRKTK